MIVLALGLALVLLVVHINNSTELAIPEPSSIGPRDSAGSSTVPASSPPQPVERTNPNGPSSHVEKRIRPDELADNSLRIEGVQRIVRGVINNPDGLCMRDLSLLIQPAQGEAKVLLLNEDGSFQCELSERELPATAELRYTDLLMGRSTVQSLASTVVINIESLVLRCVDRSSEFAKRKGGIIRLSGGDADGSDTITISSTGLATKCAFTPRQTTGSEWRSTELNSGACCACFRGNLSSTFRQLRVDVVTGMSFRETFRCTRNACGEWVLGEPEKLVQCGTLRFETLTPNPPRASSRTMMLAVEAQSHYILCAELSPSKAQEFMLPIGTYEVMTLSREAGFQTQTVSVVVGERTNMTLNAPIGEHSGDRVLHVKADWLNSGAWIIARATPQTDSNFAPSRYTPIHQSGSGGLLIIDDWFANVGLSVAPVAVGGAPGAWRGGEALVVEDSMNSSIAAKIMGQRSHLTILNPNGSNSSLYVCGLSRANHIWGTIGLPNNEVDVFVGDNSYAWSEGCSYAKVGLIDRVSEQSNSVCKLTTGNGVVFLCRIADRLWSSGGVESIPDNALYGLGVEGLTLGIVDHVFESGADGVVVAEVGPGETTASVTYDGYRVQSVERADAFRPAPVFVITLVRDEYWLP